MFPNRKDFTDGRFAYITPRSYGRARLCVTRVGDEMFVDTGY